MSAISEQVRTALYAKLNVSGVTSLATNGVHYRVAPAGTELPFVVFDRVPGVIDWALGNNVVGERDRWMIKAVVDEDSSSTLSPPQLAEDILTACDTAIGGALTLSSDTCHMARRVAELPNFTDDAGDRTAWTHGFWLEVYCE